jgi:plastocyanin
VSPSAPSSPAAGIQLELATTAASPLSFTTNELAAPGGTQVTVTYDNQSTTPHNLSFYAGGDASAPLLASTEVAAGPVTQELTFTTPSEPGDHLFRCDVHPDTMRGTLTIR